MTINNTVMRVSRYSFTDHRLLLCFVSGVAHRGPLTVKISVLNPRNEVMDRWALSQAAFVMNSDLESDTNKEFDILIQSQRVMCI